MIQFLDDLFHLAAQAFGFKYRPHLLPKLRSKRIMKAADGSPCTLRVASFVGKPCASDETVVACHLPVGGKGLSSKVTDPAVAFGCQTCHDIVDWVDGSAAGYIEQHYGAAYYERLLCALVETHTILLLKGVIVVPDAEWEA